MKPMNQRANRARMGWILSIAAALGSASPAAAQYTWTGAGVGVPPSFDGYNWSNSANWQGGIPASAATTSITFASAPTGASSNNIGSPFVLNSLTFNVPIALTGNSLSFQGPSCTINQNTAGPVTVANNLVTSSSGLYLLGSGTGSVTLSGAITGNGFVSLNSSVSQFATYTTI